MAASMLFSLYERLFFALTTKADVQHIQQQFHFDCGHTCLKMVIQYCDIPCDKADAFNDIDALVQFRKPLWTIDLYTYLMQHGVNASFYTLCVSGVTSNHESIEWYQGTSLLEDAHRVKSLFKQGVEEQWPIFEFLKDLWAAPFVDKVAIVLVDSTILNMSSYALELYMSSRDCKGCNSCSNTSNCRDNKYTGHYIVLIGYNSFRESFMHLDPAKPADHGKWINALQFDMARRHAGTDEDIIICEKQSVVKSSRCSLQVAGEE